MRQLFTPLLIVLSLILCISAYEYAIRDYESTNHGLTNPWEIDFSNAADDDQVEASGADGHLCAPTTCVLYDNRNHSRAVGKFRFKCLPNGQPQFDSSIPISFDVEVQQRLRLTDVYIWIGPQGTQPSSDYSDWENPSIPSGGVTFVYHNLHGFLFNRQITLGDILSVLTAPDGSYRTCFRIEIVVGVNRHCGFSNEPKYLSHSPEGCGYDYQAIYPANDAYFHVGLNQGNSNDSLYFKGYCLDPTRSVYPNHYYVGQIYSSYDPVVLNSPPGQFVEAPQNFPIVNYIANHEMEYLSRFLSGHQCTWQDVQNAIWRILFPVATANDPNLRNILSNTTEECVEWIVNDASTHRNYTPHCPGGKYLLIIFPVLDTNCTKDLNTQLIAFPTGGPCLNKCAPKTCHDILRCGRKVCLTGNCAPPSPSPSFSTSSRPELPSISSAPSDSSSPAPSVSSAPSISSTPAPSVSSAPSDSSTPAPSISSTPAPSDSSTPAPSISSTPAPSQSSTPAPSGTGTPSRPPSDSASRTPARSPCESKSSRPSRSSRPVLPSDSASRTPARTPCESKSRAPSHSSSRTPARTPCESKSSYPSRSSRPVYPSPSRSPYPSISRSSSASRSQPCHNMPSASPSKSQPCHNMPSRSASASRSQPCHNMHSPSPSPHCDKGDDRGHNRP